MEQGHSVNLTGPWLGCREAAEQLVSQGSLRMPTRTILSSRHLTALPSTTSLPTPQNADGRPAQRAPRPDGEAALRDTARPDRQAGGDSSSGRIYLASDVSAYVTGNTFFIERYDPACGEPVKRRAGRGWLHALFLEVCSKLEYWLGGGTTVRALGPLTFRKRIPVLLDKIEVVKAMARGLTIEGDS
jgi:hypothetical protein